MNQTDCNLKVYLRLLPMFVIIVAIGCQPAEVAIPDSYEHWNSKEGTFALEYPSGWESKGNGNKSNGIAWAEFTDGPARIRIDATFQDAILPRKTPKFLALRQNY